LFSPLSPPSPIPGRSANVSVVLSGGSRRRKKYFALLRSSRRRHCAPSLPDLLAAPRLQIQSRRRDHDDVHYRSQNLKKEQVESEVPGHRAGDALEVGADEGLGGEDEHGGNEDGEHGLLEARGVKRPKADLTAALRARAPKALRRFFMQRSCPRVSITVRVFHDVEPKTPALSLRLPGVTSAYPSRRPRTLRWRPSLW